MEHWFGSGDDIMQSSGTVGFNPGSVLDCILPGQNQITVSGPVRIVRQAATDIEVTSGPCQTGTNGVNDVSPTEIVEMELTGGGFTLEVGTPDLLESKGHIVGPIPTGNTLACSYFEIYFKLNGPGIPTLYNQEPMIVIDTIDRVPPQAPVCPYLRPGNLCRLV